MLLTTLAIISTLLLAIAATGLLLWWRHLRAHRTPQRIPEYQPSRASRRVAATRAYDTGTGAAEVTEELPVVRHEP